MPKPLQWFRLHAEFATDPVVQSLAFEDQRHFVMLLCFKASGLLDRQFGQPQRRTDVIRKALGLDGKAWDEAVNRLAECGLIEGDLHPSNWDKRQYVSDSSAERTREYRKRMKRHGDVTVTPPETETETETKTEKRKDKVKSITSPSAPSDVSPQVWGDWQSLRKAKRAAVTATAVAGIRKEAESIGMSLEDALSMCCERGWTGFKAEWVSKQAAAADKYAAQAARVIKLLDGEVFDAKP